MLVSARFDPKLPHYWMLGAIIVLTVTVVGIPIIPVWLVFGRSLYKKQYERLECDLTERSLNIRRGFLFRIEKNIPLDKIQDVAMKEGPILRHLGLSALAVETAGQSAPQGASDATLTGVIDAPGFRDAILDQRDLVVGALLEPSRKVPEGAGSSDEEVLVEIRDSLHRIEKLLASAGRE